MTRNKVRCRIITWAVFIFAIQCISQVCGDAAILNISYITDNQNIAARQYITYCAAFNPELSSLPPASATTTTWKKLEWDSEKDLCDDFSGNDARITPGAILAVSRRNCSAYDQGMAAQKMRASGVIIASNKMFFPGQPNTTWKRPSVFPVLIVKMTDMTHIEELPFKESWLISVQALQDTYVVDGSGVILILIAVVVITIGSFRSGQQQFTSIQNAHTNVLNAMEPGNMASPSSKLVNGGSATSVHFGPAAAVIFAMFMTGLLVLMYFFYDYLVYLFIALFAIGATSGMFECFRPLLQWTKVGFCRIPLGSDFIANIFGGYLDLRGVLLLLISAGLSIFWVISRNQSYGWILLDLLGSFLLISVLTGIQLPSLKACSIFLCLLFIYDVFFVFITPFFTKDGQSVMIQVATGGYDPARDSGGGQREVIPAAFKIPHIPTGALCEQLFEDTSYSLLGFGDVMVPGFLISFLRSFELVMGIRPVYFISACLAYFFSLIVTTAALILMRSGQPALLYIVPILLITIFSIGWRRREVSLLWRGNLAQLYVQRQGRHLIQEVPDLQFISPSPQNVTIKPDETVISAGYVL